MTVTDNHSTKPLPTPSHGTRWFWEACDKEKFLIQRCTDCSSIWFYPSPICPNCSSDNWTTVEADGTGIVESFTVVHHAPSDAFRADVPYIIALVELVEGVRVMGNIVDCGPGEVGIGDDVELVWEQREGGLLYQFVTAGTHQA